MAREVLVRLAAEATSGAAGFTWGRLHAREETREAELARTAESAWRRVRKVSW